jgi:hypothetical protein
MCLLSGSDYPTKPTTEIEKFLRQSNGQYIHYWHDLNSKDRQRIRHHHYQWKIAIDNWIHSIPLVRASWRYIWRLYFALTPKRKYPAPFIPYKGSQWWALTSDCVAHAISYTDNNPEFLQFHKTTLCPDETYFHSIVRGSPLAENIEPQPLPGEQQYRNGLFALHYIDWRGDTPRSPKILDETDFVSIKQSKSLFARKFEYRKSKRLVSKVDMELTSTTKNSTATH